MGEYAEMMLDGTCCSICGEFMDFDGLSGESCGYPTVCAGCGGDEHGFLDSDSEPPPNTCDVCGKRLKNADGKRQHMRDKHAS